MTDKAVLYVCDPEKNDQCSKTNCAFLLGKTEGGCCDATFHREFAREYSDGTPMIHKRNALWQTRQKAKERKEKNV